MGISYKVNIDNSEELKKEFKNRDEQFRIEAVIHDGQYYDVDKWAKVAKVKAEDIEEYINNNEDILICKNNSYRVSCKEILNWYMSNSLDIETPIIPNNFTPKIWDGYTESEYLEKHKRRFVASLTVTTDNKDAFLVSYYICSMYGRITIRNSNTFTVYTLDVDFVRDRLYKELGHRYKHLVSTRARISFYRREVSEMSDEFVVRFMDFYSNYIRGIIKNHMSTIQIYLPTEDDIQSQIFEWVFTALQKYDESSAVPFSGYFTNVMNRWPYDLPNEALGKELSDFQRDKSRAIKSLQQENEEEAISDIELCKAMGYDYNDFIRLEEQNNRWTNLRNAKDLSFESSGDDRDGELVGAVNAVGYAETDRRLSCIISLSLLDTVLVTEDWGCFDLVLYSIITNNINENMHKGLSDEFKNELRRNLAVYERLVPIV